MCLSILYTLNVSECGTAKINNWHRKKVNYMIWWTRTRRMEEKVHKHIHPSSVSKNCVFFSLFFGGKSKRHIYRHTKNYLNMKMFVSFRTLHRQHTKSDSTSRRARARAHSRESSILNLPLHLFRRLLALCIKFIFVGIAVAAITSSLSIYSFQIHTHARSMHTYVCVGILSWSSSRCGWVWCDG